MSAWMLPRRTFSATSLTATKPLTSLLSPRVSRMMSPDRPSSPAAARHHTRSVLGRRSLGEERFHAGAPLLVREAAGDHAGCELVGARHAKIHLLIERALSSGRL